MPPPAQQPEAQQPPQHGALAGTVAAALAAGGATVAGLAPAAAAATAPAGVALTAVGVAKLAQHLLDVTHAWGAERVRRRATELRAFLEQQYPERPPSAVAEAVAGEIRREREFLRKMAARLERDLPEALRIADADRRRERVLRVLEREQRYVGMREEAMNDRAVAHMERMSVKESSPAGAFWKLSPFVREHTVGCLLMGEKFWPWAVLEHFHPPVHNGCRCQLLTAAEALERDYMDVGHMDVDLPDAARRAREAMRAEGLLQEALTPAERRELIEELYLEEEASTGGAMIALYPPPAVARALAVPGGEAPERLHVTLKFLGDDHSEIGPELKDRIRRAVAAFAAGERPLRARTAGVGSFSGHGESEQPVVAHVAGGGLQGFRSRLAEALPKGVMADTYPDFKPHLTLRYVPHGTAWRPKLQPTALYFDAVYLVIGGRRERFPLGELAEASAVHALGRLGQAQRRFEKGTHEGGQFAPKYGAGHRISLRDLPELPKPGKGGRHRAAAAADVPARAGAARLRSEWAQLDRELLPYAGQPNAPEARRIIEEQKRITKELHHLHIDTGGPEGIGEPGGPKDVVVVGAGPAGLSAALYGATEGLDTLLVDANDKPGGQAAMSSRIENVLGFPSGVTGAQLAQQGLEQVERTGAETHFGVRVTKLDWDPKTGMKRLELSDGQTIEARSVVIAGGVQFRKVAFEGSDSPDVVYGDSAALKERARGREAIIVGGANSAGQAAIDTATATKHCTLLVRRKGSLEQTMSSYLIGQLRSDPNITILEGAEAASVQQDAEGRMESVTLKDGTVLPAGAMGLFIGSTPRTDWVPVEREPDGSIKVGAEGADPLETSIPGVYAAGDVRAGSVKRVITAAGDGAAAISMTHGYLGKLKERKVEEAEPQEPEADEADRWLDAVDELDREQPYTGFDSHPRAKPGRVIASVRPGREELAEALGPWMAQRRFARGTHEGGRFAPKYGVGHPISPLKRALFRELLPELPKPPRLRAGAAREVRLGGRLVRVPEERRFDRVISGKRYVSPPGSPHVYPRGEGRAGAALGLPRPKPTHALVGERRTREQAQKAKAAKLIRAALSARAAGIPPAALRAPGWPTDEALREAGFMETAFADSARGLRFSYVAPDGASTFDITYSRDGARVIDMDWQPKEPKLAGPQLDRPPRSWEEFTADIDAYARSAAAEHGRVALLGEIRVNPSYFDHVGEHHWDGTVDLAPGIRRDVLVAAAARARGAELGAGEKERLYEATQATMHEMGHASNPVPITDYDEVGMVLEEGLAEENSQLETVRKLRRQGQDDVVQWAADHPTSPAVLGTYHSYRHAIDEVLNEAKIAPELRERMVVELKYDDTRTRLARLAEAVAAARGISEDEALKQVRDRLVEVGKPAVTWEPEPDWEGVSILTTGLTPSAGARHELGGAPVEAGDRAMVNRRELGEDGEWHDSESYGRVVAVRDVDGGFLLDMDFGKGDVEHSVHPDQVSQVEGGTTRTVFGAAAKSAQVFGRTVREGDLIRYDGRADGGLSEARVTGIVRAVNPQVPGDPEGWVIEAVTTGDSLLPGQPVLLTAPRVGGVLEPAPSGKRRAHGFGQTPVRFRQMYGPTGELSLVAELGGRQVGYLSVSDGTVTDVRVDDPARAGVKAALYDEARRLGWEIEHDWQAMPAGARAWAESFSTLDDVQARHPDVTLVAAQDPRGIILRRLRTPNRLHGQGKTSAALEDLLAYADAHNAVVGVQAEGKEAAWYEARGFARNDSHPEFPTSHVREPRPGARRGQSDYEAHDALMAELGAHELEGDPRHRPDLYMKHPVSGYTVRNDKPRTSVVNRPGEPPRVHDTLASKYGNEEPVAGSERPPKYLFRAVSEEDYQGALGRGYLQSDQRMNLADEGTVADFDDPSWYLPGKLASDPYGEQLGRILRIRYRDEDGWKLDTDGYAKTPLPIPMERVDAAPQYVTVKGTVPSSITGDPVEVISYRPTGVDLPSGKRRAGDEYRIRHRPATRESGSPMHDLAGGAYPEDFYEPTQSRYYGTGDDEYDRESFAVVNAVRGNPDAEVTVYRALPGAIDELNPGDWVTPSRAYAQLNADGLHPDEKPHIISRKVRAGDLYTQGDSINEWGWEPRPGGKRRGDSDYAGNGLYDPPWRHREPVRRPSEFLTLPKSGRLVEPATHALGVLDGLLSIPELHGPIPARATSGANTRGGFMRRSAPGSTDVYPVGITVSTAADDDWYTPESTVVHEFGHYLDNQGFYIYPGNRGMASEHAAWKRLDALGKHQARAKTGTLDGAVFDQMEAIPTPLQGWYDAVVASPEAKALRSYPDRATGRYLSSPSELWARSFAQWAALRSGDGRLLEWLRGVQTLAPSTTRHREARNAKTGELVRTPYESPRPKSELLRQWSDESFAPIAAAMDTLFDTLGWRRDGRPGAGSRRDGDADPLVGRDAGSGPGGGRDPRRDP